MRLRIKEICKIKGVSVGEVAARIGLARESLSRIISSNSTSTDTLEKIAAALGVSVPELFAPQSTNMIVCPKCGTVLEIKEKE